MDLGILGMRLKTARKKMGFSQAYVARKLDLPRTAISLLESGKRSVSTLELCQLSDLYHENIATLLAKDSCEQDDDILITLYRTEPSLQKNAETVDQISRCKRLYQEGRILKNLLGIKSEPKIPLYDYGYPKSLGEAIEQGEEVALQERLRLGIYDTPIVNISELISNLDIWVSEIKLPEEISGLFFQHKDIGLAIVVNAMHVKVRQHFSYAHEYGHALFDRLENMAISSNKNYSELVEKRVNAFAATFLMPKGGVKAFLGKLNKGLPNRLKYIFNNINGEYPIETEQRPSAYSQKITYKETALLSHYFSVSYQTAAYRLRNLGFVSDRQGNELIKQVDLGREYLRLMNRIGRNDLTENNKCWDRELRSQIMYLVLEAYQRNQISRGKVLELSKLIEIDGDSLLQHAINTTQST